MITPYDWQEGVANRAQYIESRLESGSPVLAIATDEGILALTVRRQARKIFEVYDRLLYSAIGQQSDVESLRVAAIDFAHQEGYLRSRQDVTIQRVVAALSQPIKKAFGDISTAPLVVRSLFAEVGDSKETDAFYVLDYDGDYAVRRNWAYLAGTEEQSETIKKKLAAVEGEGLDRPALIEQLQHIWANAVDPSEGAKTFAQLTENLKPDVALMHRKPLGVRRFERLTPD
jgi:proteasome alpha subunit